MAQSYSRAVSVAGELKAICNDVRALLARIDAFIPLNQATAIDWGATPKPPILQEDEDGNLVNFQFDRQSVANTIYSLTQIQLVLRNGTPAQGDHIGNIEKTADVMVRYPI